MKKKIILVIISIFILILLFSVPTNFISQSKSTSSLEYAGVPPVKMPDRIPPKE